MKFIDLKEASPLTFSGSITPDLLKSKLWICKSLDLLNKTEFSTVYILGSWYGNMGFVLSKCNIKFKKIINVDLNKKWLMFSHKLLNTLGINVQSMNKDANRLSYKQADKNSLIINTSINEIKGKEWFDHIPKGTLVILQSRNNADNIKYETLQDFDRDFFLSETLILDQLTLKDPETQYQRFMKIGIK